jgi:hypothetical protein
MSSRSETGRANALTYKDVDDDEAQRQMQRVNFVGDSTATGAVERTTNVS